MADSSYGKDLGRASLIDLSEGAMNERSSVGLDVEDTWRAMANERDGAERYEWRPAVLGWAARWEQLVMRKGREAAAWH